MKFGKFEVTEKNEEGAVKLRKWIEDIHDVADMRGMTNERRVFAMAKRLLRGDIKDKFEQRYMGDRTLADLQKFIFEEISPRDPVDYYRRKLMSLTRKPGQKVESFEQKFLTIKRALEMALGIDKLADDMAVSAFRNALKGSVGTDLEKTWMREPPTTLDKAMRDAREMERIIMGDTEPQAEEVALMVSSDTRNQRMQMMKQSKERIEEQQESQRLSPELEQLHRDVKSMAQH